MTLIDRLTPRPSIIVFDAYGTLLDVHSAVMRHAATIGPQAQAFSDTWRAKQLEYTWVRSLMGQHQDFWQLTQEALDYALAKFPQVDVALRPALLATYRVLDSYPEAVPLMDRLRAQGCKTAILSNGAPGMLASACNAAGLTAKLDRILSIESAGMFKTAPETYRLVLDAFGCGREDVLLVSSNRWDVAGATAFGFRCAWVNRAGNPDEYRGLDAVAVLTDLTGIG